MRPPVGERPVGMYQLCAPVLIAAILRSVIRAAEMTPVGACREWPMPKLADDRRGAERVRAEDCAHRAKGTTRKRTVPALDPGGGSRCRPAALSSIFIRRGEPRLMGQCSDLTRSGRRLPGRARRL